MAWLVAACGDSATKADTSDSAGSDTGASDTGVVSDTTPDDSGPSDTGAPSDTTVDDSVGDTTIDTDTGGCAPAQCAALAEERAALELAEIGGDDVALTTFLRDVPKGGDLHNHLSGAIYAETYLLWAAADGYCIDLKPSNYLSLTRTCGTMTAPIPAEGTPLFDEIVALWSMERFDFNGSESGHDHFFATFGKFGAISGDKHGLMLADVMRRAARENEVYIEPMLTSNSAARTLGDNVWSANHGSATLVVADLPAFYAEIMAASGLPSAVSRIVEDVVETESIAFAELGCDSISPEAACAVSTRYQVYISRSGTLPGVFAQMVAAYEAGIDDARVVGLNLVGPEDNSTSLQRYDVEMAMLGFMNETYRATGKSPVRLSLHAGELTSAFLSSSQHLDTLNHITKAIERARAERIGHGVDLNFEADPEAILDQLRDGRILVEICLASNDQILEISGADHPLHDYLDADVPVALGTDDQGVARSSLAGEYRRAVLDQDLDYRTLKRMARMSLEYAFLPGESLWFDLEGAVPATPCVHDSDKILGLDTPPPACVDYIIANERAGLQYELERRFRIFEAAR